MTPAALAHAAGALQAGESIVAARIIAQTTTTLVAAVASKSVSIVRGTACVDANGATTAVTFEGTDAVNIYATSFTYVLAAGQCKVFRFEEGPHGKPTAPGIGLDLVTTTGAGPVQVELRVRQQ